MSECLESIGIVNIILVGLFILFSYRVSASADISDATSCETSTVDLLVITWFIFVHEVYFLEFHCIKVFSGLSSC